jgi:hypothetical protein
MGRVARVAAAHLALVAVCEVEAVLLGNVIDGRADSQLLGERAEEGVCGA